MHTTWLCWACISFHVYLLILLKVFKAMSTNETDKKVTCRETGSFLNQEVTCNLLHDM